MSEVHSVRPFGLLGEVLDRIIVKQFIVNKIYTCF